MSTPEPAVPRAGTPFPELSTERDHLDLARACRDEMIRHLEHLDPESGASDLLTVEYIQASVGDTLADLRRPGSGDFFGRIDVDTGTEAGQGRPPTASAAPGSHSTATEAEPSRWYIGRRHIETPDHTPVVVDWRAPVAASFYRATSEAPLGLRRRRRFTLADGELVAYLDEHLDDPDALPVAGGVPDPVLAEIGAARTGAMREIVATIQGEQDRIIRLPLERALAVQGGPGSGKTAVGLHRAAFQLFEHRARLARDGVLVVGPNRVFLDYIADVLPSLGERSVRQATLSELAIPRVDVDAEDPDDWAEAKGDADMAARLARAARDRLAAPGGDVRCPFGSRTVTITAADLSSWRDAALAGTAPFNQRRSAFRALVARHVDQRLGQEGSLARLSALKAEVERMWPVLKPVTLAAAVLDECGLSHRTARRRRWSPADQILVDEAHGLLERPVRTYGFAIVDEAQDLTAMALRLVHRRVPSGNLTLLGDLAQATAPGGQRSWRRAFSLLGLDGDIESLTVGYRVPGPILDVANRLLDRVDADVAASRAARVDGAAPVLRLTDAHEQALAVAAAAAVEDLRRRHKLSGIIGPEDLGAHLADALAAHGLRAAGRVQGLGPSEVPVLAFELAKGLELDGVVLVRPEGLLDGSARAARLLYVALTRAVQELVVVSADPGRMEVLGLAARMPAR